VRVSICAPSCLLRNETIRLCNSMSVVEYAALVIVVVQLCAVRTGSRRAHKKARCRCRMPRGFGDEDYRLAADSTGRVHRLSVALHTVCCGIEAGAELCRYRSARRRSSHHALARASQTSAGRHSQKRIVTGRRRSEFGLCVHVVDRARGPDFKRNCAHFLGRSSGRTLPFCR